MGKIVDISDATKISSKLKQEGKSIVLAGGCFDILHEGHIFFLKEASKFGVLFLLLESDEAIKKGKGNNRPINNQLTRLRVLSAIPEVGYVIPLSGVTKDEEYDKLIVQIEPDIIAMTRGDSQVEKRKGQCKLVDAKLKLVDRLKTASTTDLIKN